jgi:hypothetical protein
MAPHSDDRRVTLATLRVLDAETTKPDPAKFFLAPLLKGISAFLGQHYRTPHGSDAALRGWLVTVLLTKEDTL